MHETGFQRGWNEQMAKQAGLSLDLTPSQQAYFDGYLEAMTKEAQGEWWKDPKVLMGALGGGGLGYLFGQDPMTALAGALLGGGGGYYLRENPDIMQKLFSSLGGKPAGPQAQQQTPPQQQQPPTGGVPQPQQAQTPEQFKQDLQKWYGNLRPEERAEWYGNLSPTALEDMKRLGVDTGALEKELEYENTRFGVTGAQGTFGGLMRMGPAWRGLKGGVGGLRGGTGLLQGGKAALKGGGRAVPGLALALDAVDVATTRPWRESEGKRIFQDQGGYDYAPVRWGDDKGFRMPLLSKLWGGISRPAANIINYGATKARTVGAVAEGLWRNPSGLIDEFNPFTGNTQRAAVDTKSPEYQQLLADHKRRTAGA